MKYSLLFLLLLLAKLHGPAVPDVPATGAAKLPTRVAQAADSLSNNPAS